MQYRGIYAYNPEKEEVVKIHGVGPKVLMEKSMDRFYKYARVTYLYSIMHNTTPFA